MIEVLWNIEIQGSMNGGVGRFEGECECAACEGNVVVLDWAWQIRAYPSEIDSFQVAFILLSVMMGINTRWGLIDKEKLPTFRLPVTAPWCKSGGWRIVGSP
ncbi:hypothetical protein LJR129_001859 [Acidovorax sp. LjRoot129]|uniref:hypothetical protein n=1 Tax=Acidovorax sp. LjRoot129 TaxID=3342260 RepID=UPI003ECED13A